MVELSFEETNRYAILGREQSGFELLEMFGAANVQLRRAKELKLLDIEFNASSSTAQRQRFVRAELDDANLREQLQNALDYMASVVDRSGKPRVPGLASDLTLLRNLFAYLVRVAVRVAEQKDLMDTEGIDFLFDEYRVTVAGPEPRWSRASPVQGLELRLRPDLLRLARCGDKVPLPYPHRL
ncbi:hypothetical protein LTR09_005251 [Extremus antarcticus]|uniref:Uncharacterized protein n=1 Tax=Extremus antarcticus TaxID=702011 RepID=A0AAJ0DNR2_9PEZI|nr:hypothetical protein LTR09_005251 [Extremus antarcticus]